MPRPRQNDMDLGEAPGVAPVKVKALETLGYKFRDLRDEKTEIAEKMGKIESQMLDIMAEKGIEKYRFGDQELYLKKGKNHTKIKTVKVDADQEQEDEKNSAGE